MTVQNIIKDAIRKRGYTYSTLAEALGYKTFSGVSEKLRSNTRGMTIVTLLKFAEALNCEVVIRSKLNDGKEWVIDNIEDAPKKRPLMRDFEYDEETDTWVRKKEDDEDEIL